MKTKENFQKVILKAKTGLKRESTITTRETGAIKNSILKNKENKNVNVRTS